mmetsp:Transcript_15708/g.34059  ORF Transcript_15708/g.34059 Transcript_15708/m.34059 type:complete len:288 (+) Transcript_15708:161-1024(+)
MLFFAFPMVSMRSAGDIFMSASAWSAHFSASVWLKESGSKPSSPGLYVHGFSADCQPSNCRETEALSTLAASTKAKSQMDPLNCPRPPLSTDGARPSDVSIELPPVTAAIGPLSSSDPTHPAHASIARRPCFCSASAYTSRCVLLSASLRGSQPQSPGKVPSRIALSPPGRSSTLRTSFSLSVVCKKFIVASTSLLWVSMTACFDAINATSACSEADASGTPARAGFGALSLLLAYRVSLLDFARGDAVAAVSAVCVSITAGGSATEANGAPVRTPRTRDGAMPLGM